ncbi:MAG: DUF4190 domain-containing protein [Phycisphaerales bacterium]|nr:DUF4190 domain-containing protein [Phycisphaerales bacterium]MCI0631817.1 DUF4190 domain-containing protein [Phycisphaerales bacterium]MCI0675814.1 DUF4190 domain-containing protein [Phycisphaerales bacterium]
MTQYMPPPIDTPPQFTAPLSKTSGLAVASLVLAILGFCTAGLTGLVGLILGIVALSGINKSAGRITGSGLAITGIIVGACSMLCLPLQVGMILPALVQARMNVQHLKASSSLQQVGNAFDMYTLSNNQQLPPADSWDIVLASSIPQIDQTLAHPSDPQAGRAFAMNAKLNGLRIDQLKQPGSTVLVFECAPGSPLAGGPELLPEQPRNRSAGFLVLFADGSVRPVPKEDVELLNWEP